MSEQSPLLSVKPIIIYPREAQAGKNYLMTIDLEAEESFEWQYQEEEYPIYCEVDSDLFRSKPVNESVLVLHRFGGSYGEVRFLLTAVQREAEGKIRVILINKWGVPVKIFNLNDVQVKLNKINDDYKIIAYQPIEKRTESKITENISQYIRNVLPNSWLKVREILEKDSRNYISLEEYIQICQKQGFKTLEDKLTLSSYFHDLGVFIHFQDDNLLSKIVILNPVWVVDAIYKVLDNIEIRQNLGRFTRNNLSKVWNEEKYTNVQDELLRLMIKFYLCYEIPSCKDTFIAPQLLPSTQPEYNWDETENFILCYEYEFMPKGILTKFILATNSWIKNQNLLWKTGVILEKDKVRVEVIEFYHSHQGKIRIRVSGKYKQDLLTTVISELDKVHISYGQIQYQLLIPCNCATCKNSQAPHFYSWNTLLAFMENEKLVIECHREPFQMVEIQQLSDDFAKNVKLKTYIENEEYNVYTYDANFQPYRDFKLGEYYKSLLRNQELNSGICSFQLIAVHNNVVKVAKFFKNVLSLPLDKKMKFISSINIINYDLDEELKGKEWRNAVWIPTLEQVVFGQKFVNKTLYSYGL